MKLKKILVFRNMSEKLIFFSIQLWLMWLNKWTQKNLLIRKNLALPQLASDFQHNRAFLSAPSLHCADCWFEWSANIESFLLKCQLCYFVTYDLWHFNVIYGYISVADQLSVFCTYRKMIFNLFSLSVCTKIAHWSAADM